MNRCTGDLSTGHDLNVVTRACRLCIPSRPTGARLLPGASAPNLSTFDPPPGVRTNHVHHPRQPQDCPHLRLWVEPPRVRHAREAGETPAPPDPTNFAFALPGPPQGLQPKHRRTVLLIMLTRAQIISLAPDDSSAAAAQQLAASKSWVTLAKSDRAIWAEIQGSGKNPYRVCADFTATANRCTCPSRKRPCKHALALLLRAADSLKAFTQADEPSWVLPLFESKPAKTAPAAPSESSKANEVAKSADRAKRAARREKRIAEGVAECRAWLDDMLAEGLGAARTRPTEFWERPAARLIDAQAPGLARSVRRMRDAVIAPGEWASRGLEHAASLHLLLRAHDRLAELPEPLQAEVRSRLGWTITKDEVLAGECITDTWAIVGIVEEEEERIRVRRTWLSGVNSGQEAHILDYAVADRGFGATMPLGTAVEGDIAFYPGARRSRGIIKSQTPAPWPNELGDDTCDVALSRYAEALAADPWVERVLLIVRDVRLIEDHGQWVMADRENSCLPLMGEPPWKAIAIAAGGTITLAGEYDGHAVRPLAGWLGDDVFAL